MIHETGDTMNSKAVQIFTKKDEEFVSALVATGSKKTVARVLVYLFKNAEGTMREIEHGTDLNEPQVSIALKYMEDHGWISVSAVAGSGKGRPNKKVALKIPVREIVDLIEEGQKSAIANRLALLKKAKGFVA